MTRKLKILILALIAVILIAVFGSVILFNGNFFGDKELELANIKNEKTGEMYKLTSYSGNATAPSTLKLYKMEKHKEHFLKAIETYTFYNEQKGLYHLNDSIVNIILKGKKVTEVDTFQVVFSPKTIYLKSK